MTNEELTAIYNDANGLDPKRHNPITTERIFAAMRAAIAMERHDCEIAVWLVRQEATKPDAPVAPATTGYAGDNKGEKA